MKTKKTEKGIKCTEGIEYISTLRCREFTIDFRNALKAFGLPEENIVDIYVEGLKIHILTDTTIIEEDVIQK